ncbi:putative ABC-type sulfate transporter [Helianthus annuus]|nr:putative ABC-type sulfate transporter [Helianthus annuus]
MAATYSGDDLARSMSRRRSVSSSGRSWASASIREALSASLAENRREDDEEELKWAAIEKLPTYDRLKKGIFKHVLDDGQIVHEEMDVTLLGPQEKKQLIESMFKVVEEDNEKFLNRVRARTDRVGIDIPKIEVRYKNLSIEGDVHVGSRALPTLLNATLNTIEGLLRFIRLVPSKKRVVKILHDASGIVRPSRMTLLLGPPGSGKTTLLKALAGVLDSDLRVTGEVTYCGHDMSKFIPQRTCAYISQHDVHHGEMTVRETLDFAGRCLGVGTRYDLLAELSRREKLEGIKPNPEIDAFMKATAVAGQESSLVTDYVLKILGLDVCAEIMVGDQMRRGISGGQKKRLTTGEMLVGPAKVFFMDEISTVLAFFKQLLAYIGLHQMALSLFRFISALGRTQVVASALGTFSLLLVFVLGGFIVAKDDIQPWMIWGYYISPMMYAQNAIAINEFLDDRWSRPNPDTRINEPTVGKVLLRARGMFTSEYMFWVCIVALFVFSLLFTLFFVLALTYLNRKIMNSLICVFRIIYCTSSSILVTVLIQTPALGDSKTVVPTEDEHNQKHPQTETETEMTTSSSKKKGMVLPFKPLSLAFDHVNYYVDMPAEMKAQGIEDDRLQLLEDVSGAFRPGVLTALVGVSGAGKTTLMDVLAGRKTGGYIDGNISISGFLKKQETFARVSGYCEQNDIHSPHVTVYESLVYSAWLRLSPDVTSQTCLMFVEEVMDLVELSPLRNALVGLPGVDGLSTEQRKRLTIGYLFYGFDEIQCFD